MEERLNKVLFQLKKPISIDRICTKLGVSTSLEMDEVYQLLERGVSNYSIIKTPNDRYIPIDKTSFRKGIFFGNRDGSGKVIVHTYGLDNKGRRIVYENKYIVDRDSVCGAIDGDVVLIDSFMRDHHGTLGGRVDKIISRNLTTLYGEVEKVGDKCFLKPIDKKKSSLTVMLDGDYSSHQRVEVSLDQQLDSNSYMGHVSRIFHHEDDASDDVLWEAFKFGIEDKFSDESIHMAKKVPQVVLDKDIIGRVDLRNQEIFTIDGSDTKDIDDAISCRKLNNGNYLLGVHIADVSHYVLPSSSLDQDAFKRGVSHYLVGRVIPMFPRELSNGICSLNPGVDRLAVSCMMEITPTGSVIHHDIYPSVVHSNMKMTYEEVNDLLDNGVCSLDYAPFSDTLSLMKELSDILFEKRKRCGAIEFNRPELKVHLDKDNMISSFSSRLGGTSEQLIEEFMLIANETVAHDFEQGNLPFIYRVHDGPNQQRMDDFMKLIEVLNINYEKDPSCHKNLQNLTNTLFQMGNLYSVFSSNLLQCMSRAKYSSQNIGHFGLAFPHYCHFTSPIRRYPDLVVHRLIKDFILDTTDYDKKKEQWEKNLSDIASHCSKMERISNMAEEDSLRMKCSEYMERHIGSDYMGNIIGVSANGLHVQLDNLIEGSVRIHDLDGNYIYHPDTFSLLSLDGFENYSIGDRLCLTVKSASKENKSIHFKVNGKIVEKPFHHVLDSYRQVKVKSRKEK